MASEPSSSTGDGASSESFWGAATAKPGPARTPDPGAPKKWSLRKKILVGAGIGVALVIVLGVTMGLPIAGLMAPGMIESGIGKSISGSVKVKQTSFSWGGPQSIGPIEIAGSDGKMIARISIESTAGVWGLATGYLGGSIDAGRIGITGKAAIVRSADGQTNLERALAPSGKAPAAAPPGKPGDAGVIRIGDLPPIRAGVSIKELDITYTDSSQAGDQTYTLKGFTADSTIDIGSTSGIKASLKMATKMGLASGPTGDLKAAAKFELPAAAGVARLADASLSAQVSLTSAPVKVIDALALQKGRLIAAFGETADLELNAAGSLKDGDATLVARSANASADTAFKINNGTVTASKTGTISARGQTLRALVPAIDRSLAEQKLVTVAQLPDVSVEIKSLSLLIPRDPSKIDLRGTALDLGVKTTGITGTVAIDRAQGAAPSAFSIAPIDLHVSTSDLAGTAAIAMGTSATIDNKPGGNVRVDLTAGHLLDAVGAPSPAQATVQGTVDLAKLSTAIAQPFVQALKLDLPRDVGPELDVHLTASATPAAGGALPATNLDADIQGQNVRIKGAFAVADGVLKTRGEGMTAAIASAGSIASRFVEPGTGFALAPAGQVQVTVRSLSLPLPTGSAPFDLGKLSADFDSTVGGMSLMPVGVGAGVGAIELRTLKTSAQLLPGATPKVSVSGEFQHDRQPFTLTGAMELKGLLASNAGKTEISPRTLKPQGTIELKNVPTSLASVFGRGPAASSAAVANALPAGAEGLAPPAGSPKPPPTPLPDRPAGTPPGSPAPGGPGTRPAEKGFDLAALLRGAVGPTVDVKIDSTPRDQALDVVASVKAQNMVADLAAGVEDRALDLKKASVVSTIAPDTVQAIMDLVMPDLAQRPRLLRTTSATVQVSPVRIPLSEPIFSGFKPDIANSPDATLTISLPERTLVQGLSVKNADGTLRDLGSVGVEGFQVTATFPPAALAGSTARWTKQARAAINGRVLSGTEGTLMTLTGDASADLSAAGVAGKSPLDRLSASIKAQKIELASVERLAAQDPGFITGAVGDTANLTVNLSLAAPAGGGSLGDSDVGIEAAVDTPRLKIPEPVKLKMQPDRVGIASPIKVQWEIEPAWANRFLEAGPSAPGRAAAAAPARFTKPVKLSASVSSLSISRGEGTGPLKPGIFALKASAEAPVLEMVGSDGSTITLGSTTFNVQSRAANAANAAEAGSIDVDLAVANATVARPSAAPVQAKDMEFSLEISRLADEKGVVQTQTATVDAHGNLPVIPVPLLDLFAKQDGLLTDALGPVAEATIRADKLSRGGGSLEVHAKSARANASIVGTISGEVFATTQPLNVTVTEVSQELTQRLLKGVPFIGSVEKTPQDQPATVVGTNLKVPLDNDLRKLSGTVVVDPGEARFTAGGDFGKILSALKQKAGGVAGKRLEPLNVELASGVATYQRWSLPLGEFQVQTEGKVDLVNKTIDVITWLPVGALTDEAAGLFKSSTDFTKLLGGKGEDKDLSAATMVPWRTRGTFERNKTEPDLELFAKEVIKKLKPEDLIKKGVEDLLKKKVGGNK